MQGLTQRAGTIALVMFFMIVLQQSWGYGGTKVDKGNTLAVPDSKAESNKGQYRTNNTAAENCNITPVLFLLGQTSLADLIITASSFESTGGEYHPPNHAYDGNFNTRWSSHGKGEWLQFAFAEPITLNALYIDFYQSSKRAAFFSISCSSDGISWAEVFHGQSSSDSYGFEKFPFSTEMKTRFVRITGTGNTYNDWNSIREVYFPGFTQPTCSDTIENQDESGIDCGGICGGNCCNNGFLDSKLGETDVDCGGSCAPCQEGVTYYVSSSSGDNDNNGLSPATAWQTIAKVNGASLLPGDSVLFKRGDTWREELIIQWSGTENKYITFGSFGSGKKPRILGSERVFSWVMQNSNVWRTTSSINRPYNSHPASIFFGEHDGTITWGRTQDEDLVNSCGNNFSLLTQEYDWCWNASSEELYVWAEQNPASAYNFIEVPQRRGSITMRGSNPDEYIIIDGLEMLFGTMYGYNDGWPMNSEVNGLIIKNCHIGYIGIRGSDSAMGLVIWHSEMLVQNNDIHDCGRRNISYNIYTDNGSQPNGMVFENVIFENNTLHNGYHTTGFDISHGNQRESTLRNFIFRNNLIYDVNTDNPNERIDDYTSMGLYLWSGAAEFVDFQIHNNVFKNIKQKGLAIGSDNGRHLNLKVYNNVFYGMNPNISNYRAQAHISGNHQNLRFNNNLLYGTIDHENYVSRCLYLGTDLSGVASVDFNLYYQDFSRQQIINVRDGKSYQMDDWQEYQDDTGYDAQSPPPQNPLFVDPVNNDFHLKTGSIGIHRGTDVGLPYTGVAPNIGIDDAIGSIGVIE